nr:hypothetical protein [Sodalis-like endosymbiont of Proechinophthirus fluctus]
MPAPLIEKRHTMVIVTHDMRFARDVADRAIFMDEVNIADQILGLEVFVYPGYDERTGYFSINFSALSCTRASQAALIAGAVERITVIYWILVPKDQIFYYNLAIIVLSVHHGNALPSL